MKMPADYIRLTRGYGPTIVIEADHPDLPRLYAWGWRRMPKHDGLMG